MSSKINPAAQNQEDLVFESKNRAYGAYQLRRTYDKRLAAGLLSTVGFFVLALLGTYLIDPEGPPQIGVLPPESPKVDDTISIQIQPPPKIEAEKKTETGKDKALKVVEKEVAHKDTLPDQDEKLARRTFSGNGKGMTGTLSIGGSHTGKFTAGVIKKEKKAEDDVIDMPQHVPTAIADLQALFSQHLSYPDLARQIGIEGTVYVSVVVKKDGSIDKPSIKIARGLKHSAGLEEEAMRLVSLIPDGSFSPGKNGEEAVNVRISIPVRFVLTR